MSVTAAAARTSQIESSYAWWRLLACLVLGTIGGVGMWSVAVTLPIVQAEFDVARADASLPYTFTMLGFVVGGIAMGRLADRRGVIVAVLFGTTSLVIGYLLASRATSLWQFTLIHGVVIGMLGSSATFSPLVADVSHWFERRRGIAVAVAASGSYLAGTVWPPILQRVIEAHGWRPTYVGIAAFCLATMPPLAFALRRPAPGHAVADAATAGPERSSATALGITPNALQALLIVAGVACCVAMAMPQVHIVAYCGDLGYGIARGAEMLSVMLGCGVISRLAFGFVTDRIGAVATLLLGSVLQAVCLLLYLPFDGLVSLYVISALFGLFQGGIVPSYAVIVRQFFPARDTGLRVGLVLSATIAGMAFGGWLSGAVFDATGSYQAAFLNGFAWNLLNIAIAAWLLWRAELRRPALAG